VPIHPTRLGLLGSAIPEQFEVDVLVLGPGCVQAYRADDWHDALVEVEDGQVELELHSGARRRLSVGDVLWLCDVPARALHNCQPEPAVLVRLSRASSRRIR
jgi:quercetin dioxygenase-like cupin family protein